MIPAFAPNAPAFTPSLNLDFTTGVLDPRITFSRPTTATYTDSYGLIKTAAINAPRFDCNPVTLQPKGLLIEEQRTNLLTYSEQFDNAAWSDKLRVSISANQVVSPAGELTADKVIEDSTTNTHYVARTVATSAGSAVFSVYVKAAERTQCGIRADSGSGGVWSIFNLATGTVLTQGSGHTASISSVGNGWYRLSVVFTATASSFVGLGPAVSGNQSYTGNGYSGIYIWGAQLEAGSFPTSYIPTVASQVTRSADSASMTGSNFSSWYRADEGTLFTEWGSAPPPSATVRATASFMPTSGIADYMILSHSSVGGFIGVSNSIVQFIMATPTLSSPQTGGKIAGAYKLNDFAVSANGETVVTDVSGTVPQNITKLLIGAFAANPGYLNGTIKRIAYYPKRLSNSQLRAITS